MEYPTKTNGEIEGCGSVGKLLAAQAWGPEFGVPCTHLRSLSWWCKPVLLTLEDGDRPTPGVPEPASLLSEFQASETLSQKRWTVAEKHKVVLWTPRSATPWLMHAHTYIHAHVHTNK